MEHYYGEFCSKENNNDYAHTSIFRNMIIVNGVDHQQDSELNTGAYVWNRSDVQNFGSKIAGYKALIRFI